jgi:predicted transport protein
MKLFKVNKSSLVEISKSSFDFEKDIQGLVENNLKNLFNLEFISSEFTVGEFRLDSLGFNEETNSFVIIEYKKGSSYSVVDQGYSYLSVMINNTAEFILKYNTKTKKFLDRKDFDWSQSRVIFISPSFNSYQKNSVNFKDVPFELWEIQKYEDGIISFEQHKPSSRESIDKFNQSNKLINTVSDVVTVFGESDHTSKTNESSLEAWEALKEYYLSNNDIELNIKKNYISFKKKNTAICYVTFQKTKLLIDILLGYERAKSKGNSKVLKISDPEKKGKDVVTLYSSGDKEFMYRVHVTAKRDIDYLLLIINQKLNSI